MKRVDHFTGSQKGKKATWTPIFSSSFNRPQFQTGRMVHKEKKLHQSASRHRKAEFTKCSVNGFKRWYDSQITAAFSSTIISNAPGYCISSRCCLAAILNVNFVPGKHIITDRQSSPNSANLALRVDCHNMKWLEFVHTNILFHKYLRTFLKEFTISTSIQD